MRFVLYDQTGRKYPVKKDAVRTKFGNVKVDKEGVIEQDGKVFFAARANLLEEVEGFKMGGRPIYPYDSGVILALLGVRKGTKLLEAGTGSGGLAYTAWCWGANVISYEREETFYQKAKENLSNTDVEIILGDVKDCVKKGYFDVVMLDLSDPEEVIPKVSECLKNGGMLGYFSPVITENVKNVMEDSGFIDIRGIVLDHRVLRLKKHIGIEKESLGYPGFFVFGRKAECFKVLRKHKKLFS